VKRILASLFLFLTSVGFTGTTDNSEYSKNRKAKKLARKFLRQNDVQGLSISVSKNGKLIWSKGFGYANKTIDINKSIYNYLPDYPKKSHDFTVKELGGHLAGIRSYRGNEFTLNKKMSISEGVDLFKNDPLLFEPSTQFFYCSYGYVLLSDIIQKASKTDFTDLVMNTIFKPLGMTNTMLEDSEKTYPNITSFYNNKRQVSSSVTNEYKVAGGGFLSTSEDLIKFGEEIILPKTVSKEALANMTTSQKLKSGKITGYGIGFSVGHTKNNTPKYGHTGGGVGASTVLTMF